MITVKFGISENEDYEKMVFDALKSSESNLAKLRERVAQEIANNIDFSNALITVWNRNHELTARQPDISVSVRSESDRSLVIVSGADAVWVEFGTGVYHNKTDHEWGASLGFTIGGYGLGHGNQETWAYFDTTENEVKYTHGIEASRSMYRAVTTVMEQINTLAVEVFR